MMSCKDYQNDFVDYVLEQDPKSALKLRVDDHLAACAGCSEELAGLRKTMDLLDTWKAPEPSAYFDQKMAVLLREEQANAPAGWMERLRERLLFNTGRQFRPMMVGALALAVAVGGGSFAGLTVLHHQPAEAQASATVNDLQLLDKNAQAIEQMDQLLQDDNDGDNTDAGQPAT